METTATNERLTDAARTLLTDPGAWAEFRADPAAVAEAFGLTGDEVEALQSGDEMRLAALGADTAELLDVHAGRRRGKVARRIARRAPRLAAVLIAAGLFFAPSAWGLRRARAARMSKRTSGVRARARYGARYGARFGARARYGVRARHARARFGARYGARFGTRAIGSGDATTEAPFYLA